MSFKIKLLPLLQTSFYFIPVSLIVGSLVVNLNVLIFLILGFFFLIKNKIKINFNSINITLLLFFLFVILTSLLNIKIIGVENFIKSILLLKFFFIFILCESLFLNNKLNLTIFCRVCLCLVVLISLDVSFQFFYGKNLLGFVPHEGRIAGIFGSEAIAGGFIQKFFIFSLIGVLTIAIAKSFNKNLFEISFFLIVIFGSFVASNRMSFLIVFSSALFVLIFYQVFRKKLLVSLIIILPIFLIFYIFNADLNLKFKGFISKTEHLSARTLEALNKKEDKKITAYTNHAKIYITTIKSFRENKIIGSGLKSFRFQCNNYIKEKNTICSNHPHNYHLEILHDTGIIGFSLITLFVILILFFKYKSLRPISTNYNVKIITSLIILNFMIEIFPLKSTGSLFSTWTGTILWISIALLNYGNNYKNNEKI